MGYIFEYKEDCPDVEKFIWDKIGLFYGNFSGIQELSISDLIHLEGLCRFQLSQKCAEKLDKMIVEDD
jgi:hypothetical protein